MIQIDRFHEFVADVRGEVNAVFADAIVGTIVAVKEEHLIKKLKDCEGLWLCSNYPDCEETTENRDYWEARNEVLFFLIEKVPAGKMTDAEERAHYAHVQKLAERVKELLRSEAVSCTYSFKVPEQIKTEWEYNIYGGFNGISLGFKLREND